MGLPRITQILMTNSLNTHHLYSFSIYFLTELCSICFVFLIDKNNDDHLSFSLKCYVKLFPYFLFPMLYYVHDTRLNVIEPCFSVTLLWWFYGIFDCVHYLQTRVSLVYLGYRSIL